MRRFIQEHLTLKALRHKNTLLMNCLLEMLMKIAILISALYKYYHIIIIIIIIIIILNKYRI